MLAFGKDQGLIGIFFEGDAYAPLGVGVSDMCFGSKKWEALQVLIY
jgi:hypothetical protein